jgi:hypothetical protein
MWSILKMNGRNGDGDLPNRASRPEYAGTLLSGIKANSEEEAIESFIVDNIDTDWITRIDIVGVRLLPERV